MNVCYVDYLDGNDVQPLEPTLDKIDVIYQTYTNGRWQPNVKNTEDYAGVFGLTVTGVYANLSEGNIMLPEKSVTAFMGVCRMGDSAV